MPQLRSVAMSIEQLKTVLSRETDIDLAIVFGSVARKTAGSQSDVDIAVKAKTSLDTQHKMRLIEDLAAATGRPVDLIDLRTVGEPLLGEIIRTGQRILGSDAEFAELTLRHIYANEDFVPYLKRLLKERNAAWIN